MSVKIRLFRRGRKKLALFDVVVADARSPRDGKFLEKIGVYNPNTNPATIEINETKAFDWLMKGAQPTDTVKAMLSYKGLLFQKHLQIGVAKGAITQEAADQKLAEWKDAKTSKIEGKKTKLATDKESAKKAKQEAEVKINNAREEAIKNKNKVEEVVATPESNVESEVEAVVAPEVSAPVIEAQFETLATPEIEAPAAEIQVEAPVAVVATPEVTAAVEEVATAPAAEVAPVTAEATTIVAEEGPVVEDKAQEAITNAVDPSTEQKVAE